MFFIPTAVHFVSPSFLTWIGRFITSLSDIFSPASFRIKCLQRTATWVAWISFLIKEWDGMWHRDIRIETGDLEEEDECVWEGEFCELCDFKLQTTPPRNQLNCFLMSCQTSQHCNVLPCILSLFLPLPHIPPVSVFVFSVQPWRFPCSI